MEAVWLSWSFDQLLWATRGRFWDFRFLLQANATGLNPLSLYEAVFAVPKASSPVMEGQPQFFCAEVIDGTGAVCWVLAARFLDPDTNCRDESGRRIPHEILLVGKKCTMPDPHTAPADWHLQVFQQLVPAFRRLYSLESGDQAVVPPESIKPSAIVRQGASATAGWTDLGTLAGVKKADRHVNQKNVASLAGIGQRRSTRFYLITAAIVGLLIGIGLLAATKSHWLRERPLELKPQQKSGEPPANGTKSSKGMAPLEDRTSADR